MSDMVDVAASRWLARLDRGEVGAAERREFERWLAADRRHTAAYQRHSEVWERLLRLQRAIPPAATDADASHRSWLRTHWRAIAAGWLLLLIASMFVGSRLPGNGGLQRYSTDIGGFRRIVLADGSLLELNTDTMVRIAMSKALRHVELEKGEATFRVAPDARWPFSVSAGDTTVRALGTVFNIRRRSNGVEILIVEGRVTVASLAPTSAAEADGTRSIPPLHAGQAVMVADSGLAVRSVSVSEVARGLEWQQGMITFDAATLEQAAAEFNRYNRRPLVVDPAVAQVKIGGYFRARNVDGFLRVLQSEFSVDAQIRDDEIRLVPMDRSPRGPETADKR